MSIREKLEARGWFFHGVLSNAMDTGCEKAMTLKECSSIYKIGINKLRALCNEAECPFVLKIGSRKLLIKTEQFDQWFSATTEI